MPILIRNYLHCHWVTSMGFFMLANAGLSDMATNVRIQGGSLGRQNLVKCWSALLRDICVNLTQAATEQQWESRQVKSVDLNEHKN